MIQIDPRKNEKVKIIPGEEGQLRIEEWKKNLMVLGQLLCHASGCYVVLDQIGISVPR